MVVVEAESRLVLKNFTDTEIVDSRGRPVFPHVMIIDGNDDRGIDVGVISRSEWSLGKIRSHVDNPGPSRASSPLFSRDCPVYEYAFPADSGLAGETLYVLPNHLKSKFGSKQEASDQKRRLQAQRVAEIYRSLVDEEGARYVVVAGDLNDTPDSDPLAPLLADTDLVDIAAVPGIEFSDGGRPGTFANGTASQKIDYVLVSPGLADRVIGGGVFRKGVWGGKNGDLFEHFDTITRPAEAASDHAAIYADIRLD